MTTGGKIGIFTASHVVAIAIGAGIVLGIWHGCGAGTKSGQLVRSATGKILIESVSEKVRYIYINEKCPDGTTDTIIVDKSNIREWKLWHNANNIIMPKYYFGASGKNYGHGAGVEYYRRFGRVGIGGGGYVLAIPGQLTGGVTVGALIMF